MKVRSRYGHEGWTSAGFKNIDCCSLARLNRRNIEPERRSPPLFPAFFHAISKERIQEQR